MPINNTANYPQYYYVAKNGTYYKCNSDTHGERLQLFRHNEKFHFAYDAFEPKTINYFGGDKYCQPCTAEDWRVALKFFAEQCLKLIRENYTPKSEQTKNFD